MGAPYKDKFTYFSSDERFSASTNDGFMIDEHDKERIKIRIGRRIDEVDLSFINNEGTVPNSNEKHYLMIRSILKNYSYFVND
jgi:hypothetical protein